MGLFEQMGAALNPYPENEIEEKRYYYIEIAKKGGEVIKRLDVTNQGERSRHKIEAGMNINLNHNEYHTYSYSSKEQKPTI